MLKTYGGYIHEKKSFSSDNRFVRYLIFLVSLILLFYATYQYVLPLDSELELTHPNHERYIKDVAYRGSGHYHYKDDQKSSSSNNVTIVDFFKPYDPACPTSLPTDTYFRKINLRPLSPYSVARLNFTEWINEQFDATFEKLLSNIGDSNLKSNTLISQGVTEGAIIASPSKVSPDYFYQWIRDSAITINTVISNLFPLSMGILENNEDNFTPFSEVNVTLAGTVLKYINNSYTLQRLGNPSGQGVNIGADNSLRGLGEPKWHVDDKPFLESWGRPQNDGPALRSISIFHLLKHLEINNLSLQEVIAKCEAEHKRSFNLPFHNETELYEQILYWDLQFIIQNWQEDTFDLWEEVKGKHFFTSLVQLTTVKLGISYLRGKETGVDEGFIRQLENCYNQISTFVTMEGGFLNPNKNFVVETPSMLSARSGLDIAVIIGSLLTHDDHFPANIPFDVSDSGILNTLYSLVKSMEIIYPINHQRANLKIGVALGRYPEDIYDGVGTSEGNPWFLATAAASELLYKLILKNYQSRSDLVIPLNTWESEFWTLIFEGFEDYPKDDAKHGYQLVIPYGSPAFKQTMISIFDLGESFLDKIREHASEEGSMSEQFNKYTGYLQGARDLTWSYGAFWSSCHIRSKVLPLLS